MAKDNFEHKIAELRGTLAWTDLVLANIDEAILVLDDQWRINFANSSLAELLARDRIGLLGHTLWELPLARNDRPLSDMPGSRKTKIESINSLDAVYDVKVMTVERKLLLRGRFVPGLGQAVCVLRDVSVELKADFALMALQRKVKALKARLGESDGT